jgi:hypothetical protein
LGLIPAFNVVNAVIIIIIIIIIIIYSNYF